MSPSYPAPANAVATNNSIAYGLIAGFICVVVSLSLLCFCFFQRSKVQKARSEDQVTAFSAGRATQLWMEESIPSSASGACDRPSITIPEKSIPRNPYSHSHDKAGISLTRELSFASSGSSLRHSTLNAPSRSRILSSLNPARSKHNRSSSGFSMYSSGPSSTRSNYRLSSVSFMSSFQPRPTRQLFESSLPDELGISRIGEYLMVLQSFDDGWCLVTRDTSSSLQRSLFSVRKGESVDIGVVPSWVFIEPLKGVVVTRPFRGSSVNTLYYGGNPAEVRNTGLSWSLFG